MSSVTMTQIMKIQLIDSRTPAASLAAVDVFLEADLNQSQSASGLRATLVFVNHGAQPLTVLDPMESTFVELTTEDGWPVDHPSSAGLSFRINRGKKGEQPKNITLTPGEEHRVTATVGSVYPIDKRPPVPVTAVADEEPSPVQPRSTIPLPSGVYTLLVRTALIDAAIADSETAVRMLSSPPVVIRFSAS